MIEIPSGTRGLVFDCDGTIADTMPLHFEAWSAAMKHHGYVFSEAIFYEMAGIPSERIIELLNERHGWNVPVQAGAEMKEKLYILQLHRALPIEPVVRLIEEQSGKLPMAVATGGTRAICTKTLAAMNVLHHFAAIVTADDVQHGKPAPDIFLEAARRIGIPPAECCAFEDGELGLQSARAAGMPVIDVRPMYKHRHGVAG